MKESGVKAEMVPLNMRSYTHTFHYSFSHYNTLWTMTFVLQPLSPVSRYHVCELTTLNSGAQVFHGPQSHLHE